MTQHHEGKVGLDLSTRVLLLGACLCGVALAWSYWPTFSHLVHRWNEDPQASHGFLVPLVVAVVFWFRWDYRPRLAPQPNIWGVVVLALAGAMRFLGAFLNIEWLDEASLIVTLAGSILLLCGFAWLGWASWGLLLLFFMIPLPFFLQNGLANTLQSMATRASTYLLQTFGYPAVAEGNTIVVNQTRLGVLEACNGLGMLQSFLLLSAAMALISRRPLWERLVLLFSGLPIALLSNLIRITATALLTMQTDEVWHKRIHDVAGWLMIPLAVLLLWQISKILDNLWLEPLASRQPIPRPTSN